MVAPDSIQPHRTHIPTIFMPLTTSLLCVLSLTVVAYGQREGSLGKRATSHFQGTCLRIAAAVSNVSEVYFPRMYWSLLS